MMIIKKKQVLHSGDVQDALNILTQHTDGRPFTLLPISGFLPAMYSVTRGGKQPGM